MKDPWSDDRSDTFGSGPYVAMGGLSRTEKIMALADVSRCTMGATMIGGRKVHVLGHIRLWVALVRPPVSVRRARSIRLIAKE
jgi:hypothetical protein